MKGKWVIWLLLPAACAATGGCNRGSTEWNTESAYGIQLYRFTGPNHVQRAAKDKDAGEKLAKWSDLFIVRGASSSFSAIGPPAESSADLRVWSSALAPKWSAKTWSCAVSSSWPATSAAQSRSSRSSAPR